MTGTVVTHATDDIGRILYAGTICAGIAFIVIVVGLVAYAIRALDKGEPIFPWSARGRVARAKARAEVAEIMVREEQADIARLALEPMRQKVLQAVKDGVPVMEETLQLPADLQGERLRQAAYR